MLKYQLSKNNQTLSSILNLMLDNNEYQLNPTELENSIR